MTAAAASSRPPRVRLGGWLRSSLSSLGSSFNSSARSSMASSASSDGDSRRSSGSLSLSPPTARGQKREVGALLREAMGTDSNWTSETQVAAHFERLGWSVESIAGDGNCLFRAISDQLFGDQERHTDVRCQVVDFIERERELFAPFLELEGESVAAYCARMRRGGEWGGNPELYAAAKCFRVHLVVHQGPQRRLRIENDDGAAEQDAYRTLHLLYKGDHYRSLRPGEDDAESSGAPEQEQEQEQEPTADCEGLGSGRSVGGGSSDSEGEEAAKTRSTEPTERPEPPARRARPLVCETAEVPPCGVWIPRRVVFRRGRRRLSSAVLSLVHEPSMNHLALSVTTEIDFDGVGRKQHRSDTSATVSTAAEADGAASANVSEPPSGSDGDENRQPQRVETLEDAVPVVFARRARFHKGRPKRAAGSDGAPQRASMY